MLKFEDDKLNIKGHNIVIDDRDNVVAGFDCKGVTDGKLFLSNFDPVNLNRVTDVLHLIFESGVKGIEVLDLNSEDLDFWRDIDDKVLIDRPSRKVFIPYNIEGSLDEKKWSERSAIYNPDDSMVQRGPANPLFKEGKLMKYILSENQMVKLLLNKNEDSFKQIKELAQRERNKLGMISIGDIIDNIGDSRVLNDILENLKSADKVNMNLDSKNHDIYRELLDKAEMEIEDDDEFTEYETKLYDWYNENDNFLSDNELIISNLQDIIEGLLR